MLRSSVHPIALVVAAVLLLTPYSFAFDTPLSDQAVREAYFLGQRRDETMATLLNKYTKPLPPPKTGPYVTSITFLTPFALLVQHSSRQSNYSAQQAALDHRDQPEFVRIMVQIQLTDSYGAYIVRPTGPRSGSPTGFLPRPYDFCMTSGKISTFKFPAKTGSSGPSLLPASPISPALRTAAASSSAPLCGSTSPPKTLPPAPPPLT